MFPEKLLNVRIYFNRNFFS